MAEREKDQRLQELWDRGVKTYSFSKLNSLEQCPYGAYLNYIEKVPQKNQSVYSSLGGKVHDVIEGCVLGTKNESEITNAVEEELEDLELMGIEFPKSRDGSTSIRDNWVKNVMKFAQEFHAPAGNFKTEELLLYPIDDEHYMMGYADAIRFDEDGVWLIDWKTSSLYIGDKVKEAGRQLVIYKMALEKLGYKVKRCSWFFVKYCETTYTLKNGSKRSKVSEWRNMIVDNKTSISSVMKRLGYDQFEIDLYLEKGISANSWDVFPEDVQAEFETHPYIKDYNVTPEIEQETLDFIIDKINKYDTIDETATPTDLGKNSFFCSTLCGYGGKTGLCKYYVDYCNSFVKEDEDDDEDLF